MSEEIKAGMTERTYPYTRWTILLSGEPKMYTIVHREEDTGFLSTKCVRYFAPEIVFESRLAAIAAEVSRLKKKRTALSRRITELKRWELTI